MKVKELLKKSKAWARLWGFVQELSMSAEKCRDAELHFISIRLTEHLLALANEEVEA